MHSTKSEILALLKRSGGATVDDLSTSLGLASMTVRQHLTVLERDSLVRADEVRRATGRPHFRYELTDNGHREISDGYDRLVALLVEEAGQHDADDGGADQRRRRLFRGAAQALASRHRGEVQERKGSEQVARAVEILRSHGGFAEWHEHGDGFELRDFSCVFRATVGDSGRCDWHEPFLAGLLCDAIVEPAATAIDGCAECCRYIITTRARTSAGMRGEE